ncbi:MAG: hypothetical protein NTU85_02955 [Candidatus Kaiserbacteria bacterium]|nr:hypothetical protein [Candidatus Kaiserbacteria bacterium]
MEQERLLVDWSGYALGIVAKAIENEETRTPAVVTAAIAIVNSLEMAKHPSFHNTQFAVAAFFPELDRRMDIYAWRMIVNGLGGYWQWETHNGGTFSVTKALRHLCIISDEEASSHERFTLEVVYPKYGYLKIQKELLARIVKLYNLPTIHPHLGSDSLLLPSEIFTRKRYENCCSILARPGRESNSEADYRVAIDNM